MSAIKFFIYKNYRKKINTAVIFSIFFPDYHHFSAKSGACSELYLHNKSRQDILFIITTVEYF